MKNDDSNAKKWAEFFELLEPDEVLELLNETETPDRSDPKSLPEWKSKRNSADDERVGPFFDRETERRIQDLVFAKLGVPRPSAEAAAPLRHQDQDEPLVQETHLFPDARLAQLDSDPSRSISRRRRQSRFSAAILLIVIMAAFLFSSGDVRAQVQRVLQFLPGFGVVEEKSSPTAAALVLQQPVIWQQEVQRLTVDSALIGPARSVVSLTGSGTPLKDLTLRNEKGKAYTLASHMVSTSGGWTGTFWTDEPVDPGNGLMELEAPGLPAVRLSLSPAPAAASYEELGATSTVGEISVTAMVLPLAGSERRVELVPQLPGEWKVLSYGIQPINKDARMTLSDSDGKPYPFSQTASPFSKPNEIRYSEPAGQEKPLKLTLPYLLVQGTAEPVHKVQIPIPSKGSAEVNERFYLAGLPVDIEKVERSGPTALTVYVNTHYDAAKDRNLLDFGHNPNYGGVLREKEFGGFSSKFDERSGATYVYYFQIKKDQKIFSFYPVDPQVLMKGPWQLSLEPDTAPSTSG